MASAPAGRSRPWGQIGRLDQTCTSSGLRSQPAWTTSTARRKPDSALPWLPIWVARFLFFRELPHDARLADGLDKRLLAEAVLAQPHRPDGRHAMMMVWRGNGHLRRVNVLADFIQHLAVIAVLLELGELLRELLGLPGRVLSSTSQMATIWPPQLAASLLSLSPLPPTPMQAMLMRSLAPARDLRTGRRMWWHRPLARCG